MRKIHLLTTLLLLMFGTSLQAQVFYVKPSGNDANDGSSWGTAFQTLQKALSVASSGEIWVEAGTYYPTADASGNSSPADDRTKTFVMKNGVAIYGGFAGTETQLNDRNWKTNVTILSGDIGTPGQNSDNSYHVVSNQNVNSTAILDGFTITAGNANASNNAGYVGGGMFNNSSSPTLINCIFLANTAVGNGGGIFNNNSSSPILTNCSFSGNSAVSYGGGVYNGASSPTLTNCSFSGNSANYGGGICNISSSPALTNCNFSGNSAVYFGSGVYNHYSFPTLINCSISANSAANSGGVIYNYYYSSPVLTNCILWGDSGGEISNASSQEVATVAYSIVQGGYAGTGNLDQDPLFFDAALHLQACSPAIDAGLNSANTTTTDLDGNTRIVHNTIDIGAYEYNGTLYTWYRDADGDGQGDFNNTIESFCTQPPAGYTYSGGDCDDNYVGPCVSCSGDPSYLDADGDGFGDPNISAPPCFIMNGYVQNNLDCDDNNSLINPNTQWVLDNDNDGYYVGNPITQCQSPGAGYAILTNQQAGDCNDNNASIHDCTAICGDVSNLTTTNITSGSASFNWTAAINPDLWQVQFKSTAPGSKWIDVTGIQSSNRSVTVTSLRANQNYQWHIRAKCGKSWTLYSDAIQFKTLAKTGAITVRAADANNQLRITEGLHIEANPNPAPNSFSIAVNSDDLNSVVVLQVFDAMGRLVDMKKTSANSTIKMGEMYKPGSYYIRVVQGEKHKEITVIKIGN